MARGRRAWIGPGGSAAAEAPVPAEGGVSGRSERFRSSSRVDGGRGAAGAAQRARGPRHWRREDDGCSRSCRRPRCGGHECKRQAWTWTWTWTGSGQVPRLLLAEEGGTLREPGLEDLGRAQPVQLGKAACTLPARRQEARSRAGLDVRCGWLGRRVALGSTTSGGLDRGGITHEGAEGRLRVCGTGRTPGRQSTSGSPANQDRRDIGCQTPRPRQAGNRQMTFKKTIIPEAWSRTRRKLGLKSQRLQNSASRTPLFSARSPLGKRMGSCSRLPVSLLCSRRR